MRMKFGKKGRRWLPFAVMASLITLASSPTVYAEVSYSDSSAGVKVPNNSAYLSGNEMVWIADDSQGSPQIYYQNLSAGESRALTSAPTFKDEAVVGGGLVVWDERPSTGDSMFRDIYVYNVQAGTLKKLNTSSGQNVLPETDGRYVVWYNRSTMGDMYVYDASTGTTTQFGQGRYPVVANGIAVYLDALDQGVSMTNLRTGQAQSLYNPTDGSYVDWFTFNGNELLWKQTYLDHSTQYRLLDIGNPGNPVNLTQPSKKAAEYRQMVLGDHSAAWLENDGDGVHIEGADLQSKQTYTVAPSVSQLVLFNYVGDQLPILGTDGNLFYRSVKISVSQPTSASSSGSSGSSLNEQPPAGSTIGLSGGEIDSTDHSVQLAIPSGVFSTPSVVGLSRQSDLEVQTDVMKRNHLQLASGVWNITSQQPFGQSVTLTMKYAADQVNPAQVKKLQIARYDSASFSWQPMGGIADAASGSVKVNITQPGTYAVVLHDVTFADIQGHWAQQAIELLAAHDIVNGEEDGVFRPDDHLTRAEFTKMLAAAIGLQPAVPNNASFEDVPHDFWGHGWIEAAAKAGIVQGDGQHFHPSEPLTREQMMAMIVRAVHADVQASELSEADIRQQLPFSDTSLLSTWARKDAAMAVKMGLIQGSNDGLMPQQTSTRAQAAAVVLRLLLQQNKM